jgi:alpha-beta hydrolase superfamily lysophospholipase
VLEWLVNRFIYFPTSRWMMTPADLGLESEDVFLTPEPGVRLHAWFFPRPKPLATLLFCHRMQFIRGNTGNVSHRLENVAHLLQIGFQVLLFDYRGYGHSSGQPSEPGLYRDAAAAWAHLAERDDTVGVPRVIFGRSLGGAVAIDLATRVSADARMLSIRLVIESTFPSVQVMARSIFPFPLPTLPVKYDSLSKIEQLKMPLLVIHREYSWRATARGTN